jgi:hypothetical protein
LFGGHVGFSACEKLQAAYTAKSAVQSYRSHGTIVGNCFYLNELGGILKAEFKPEIDFQNRQFPEKTGSIRAIAARKNRLRNFGGRRGLDQVAP